MQDKESLDKFWQAIIAAGKAVLSQATHNGFGQAHIEIKYQNNEPAVAITGVNSSQRVRTDADGLATIKLIDQQAREAAFNGERTFTLVYQHGTITRIIIDEYETRMLH